MNSMKRNGSRMKNFLFVAYAVVTIASAIAEAKTESTDTFAVGGGGAVAAIAVAAVPTAPSHILPSMTQTIKYHHLPSNGGGNFQRKGQRVDDHIASISNSISSIHRKDTRTLQGTSTTTDGECVDAPFLWLIRNDNDGGKVEGLGVGSLHLPRGFIMTDNEWQSLVNAAEDGCTIFSEIDVSDPLALQNILSSCLISPTEPIYVSDLPDTALQAEIENIVTQIVEEYAPPSFNQPQTVEFILTNNGINLIYQIISYWNIENSLEYRDRYFQDVFNSVANTDFLDAELLSLGFDTGSLETPAEVCSYVVALQPPSKEELITNWDEIYADKAWAGLNSTLDVLLDSYQCGDIENFNEIFVPFFLESVWDEDEDAVMASLLDGACYSDT